VTPLKLLALGINVVIVGYLLMSELRAEGQAKAQETITKSAL